MAKDILPSGNKYSPTHAFIRLLQEKGKLLTNFTQNIDNLEGHAGIRPEKLIQCHGSFATASCLECKYKVKGEEIFKDMKIGRIARCDQCIRHLRQLRPAGLKRKRNSNGASRSKRNRKNYEDSTDSEDYDVMAAGVMKVVLSPHLTAKISVLLNLREQSRILLSSEKVSHKPSTTALSNMIATSWILFLSSEPH